MNFTRDPIIETVITARDGYKLTIRGSKGSNQEEYSVDAVEVVSFGQAIFYRNLERSKSFLLPVTDYEVVEVKEARMVLKNASIEKNVKIGKGKETKAEKETSDEEAAPKKRERRRTRRRKTESEVPKEAAPAEKEKGGEASDETKVSSSGFTGLLPPPPTLISEKITKLKSEELAQTDLFSEQIGEGVPQPEKAPEPEPAPEDLTPAKEKGQPSIPGVEAEAVLVPPADEEN